MYFYYHSVCHTCKKESPNLKKCGKCKIVHYCSREHQLQNWKDHKDICKVIAETTGLLQFNGQTAAEFNKFKIITAISWQFELKRELTVSEHEMWMFPKVCAVCYKTVADIVCNKCWSVSYCTIEHRQAHEEQHNLFCPKLKLCLEAHQNVNNEEPEWENLSFDFKKEMTKLPENVSELVKTIKFRNNVDYLKNDTNLILLTDFFCSAVNIIYALETSKFLDKRMGKKTKLVIHTTTTELCGSTSWRALAEFLSHWIYNLKRVKIFVISPNVEGNERLSFTINCVDCRSKRFHSSVVFLENEYNEYIGRIPRPDLVVMFNSSVPDIGTHEWFETVPGMLAYKNAPIILASDSKEELKTAIEKFPPVWIKFYVKPQDNMYGSLRPFRNPKEGADPVTYRNNFVAIIAMK